MKTVSGLFNNFEAAREAVIALEAAGIPGDDISLLANNVGEGIETAPHGDLDNTAAGAGMGAAVGGAGGLLAGLGLLAIPGIGPVVGAGWLAATAVGAALGGVTGGMLGALTDAGVSADDAHVYAEGVRRGGAVVSARVEEARVPVAQAILRGGTGVDIEERRGAYETGGWTGFETQGAPLTAGEIQEEQERYFGRRMPIA